MNWQTRSPKLEQHFPSPMFPAPRHCKDKAYRYPLCCLETKSFSQLSLLPSILRYPQRNWPFPVSPIVNCPDFAATVTAFFYPLIYAGANGRETSCSACGHHLQDLIHFQNYDASEFLQRAIFGTPSNFDLWSRPAVEPATMVVTLGLEFPCNLKQKFSGTTYVKVHSQQMRLLQVSRKVL